MSNDKFWFSLILPDEEEPGSDDDVVERRGETVGRDSEHGDDAEPADQNKVSTESTQ